MTLPRWCLDAPAMSQLVALDHERSLSKRKGHDTFEVHYDERGVPTIVLVDVRVEIRLTPR